MDLLKIGWVRRLFLLRWFPLAPQVILLLVFALIIAGGLGITTGDAKFAKILRNTNLANLVVWSYWWPLIIVATVLVGRIWCMVCPIELVTAVASKIGLKRQVPYFFKSGWIITIFYAVILLVGIHTLSIHRLPHRMAIYMLVLFGVAMACSLIFEKRAFCSYVCPVGHLLGLYALISPWQWRVNDKKNVRIANPKTVLPREINTIW